MGYRRVRRWLTWLVGGSGLADMSERLVLDLGLDQRKVQRDFQWDFRRGADFASGQVSSCAAFCFIFFLCIHSSHFLLNIVTSNRGQGMSTPVASTMLTMSLYL